MRAKRLVVSFVLGLGLILATMWLLGGTPGAVARAATVGVTTLSDGVVNDGACTLREAIIVANTDTAANGCTRSGFGPDVITLTAGVYVLATPGRGDDLGLTGDLDITDTVMLVGAGPGATVIDADGIDRVFHVQTTGTVIISGVTIMGGESITADGGGIYNAGANLSLINVVVARNGATAPYAADGEGGGIYVDGGKLTLRDVLIVSNTAKTSGGGLYVASGEVSLGD